GRSGRGRRRRRRRSGRQCGGVGAGAVRARRPAAGEDGVPAREGLRRRADPAGGQEPRGPRHRHQPGQRLPAQPRAADHRRRHAPRAAVARPRHLPRLRARPPPSRLRRAARPSCAEGRCPPAGADDRHRPAARRRGPRRRRSRADGPRPGRAVLPRAAGGRGRRLERAAGARPGHRQARRPSDGGGRAPLLREPAHGRRHAGVLARAARGGRQPAAGLRLGVRRRGRHEQRRPGHPQHHERLAEDRLQGPAGALDRRHAGRVAVRRRPRHRSGPRRRAADGLQPHAALQPGRAARRRRRRRRQPLQRRGHRVRHGVRAARGGGGGAGPGPPVRTVAGARARGLPAAHEGALRRLLHARPRVRAPHRQSARHGAGDAARAAPAAADEVHAQAAGQPARPARRRCPGPHHQRPLPTGSGGV
ncbi:MAG: geranylgeranyl reductase, partial [uncultured Frankineae bacterium]